MTRTCR